MSAPAVPPAATTIGTPPGPPPVEPTPADQRAAIATARHAAEAALRTLGDAQRQLAVQQRRYQSVVEINDQDPAAPAIEALVTSLIDTVAVAQQAVATAQAALTAARAGYDTAAAAAPLLFSTAPAQPALLLPVRLETVYRAASTGGAELWIRVYPDDIHIDSHEPALTPAEVDAGQSYWRAVWAAGPDGGRLAAAWAALVQRVGGPRAPWVRDRLRPAATPPATATAPGEPPPDPGPFPQVARRDGPWTRAAQTAVLPDRFVFSGYRDDRLCWRVEGAEIPDTLAVGMAPGTSATGGTVTGDLPWDGASRWLVDFDAALACGMAVVVPIPDPNLHYDVVTAVGVCASLPVADGSARVADLVQAHTYTDGMEVLPVGSPTNNTPGSRSSWTSRPTPAAPEVADARRAAYNPGGSAPAARLARALGMPGPATAAGAGALAVLDNGDDDDEGVAAQLAHVVGRVLSWSPDWPQPASFFLVTGVGFVADFFASYVRSRGPLPVLRCGRQPYGVLPATSLDLLRGADVPARIVDVVSSVATYLDEQSDVAPRVGTGSDADAVILDILSRRASSRQAWLLEDLQSGFFPPPPAIIGAIGLPSAFARSPLPRPAVALTVSDPPTPQLQALAAQRPLAQSIELTADIRTYMDSWNWTSGPPNLGATPFPARLQALQAATAPVQRSKAAGLFYPITLPLTQTLYDCTLEMEHGLHDTTSTPGVIAQFQAGLNRLTEVLDTTTTIEAVAATDLARVERLMAETLDTTSHRLDAWVTAVATARLASLRAAAPAGLHLGAYGWVVDLAPLAPGRRTASDGYVVAPSLQHATTAAVLRSGYLAHTDTRAFAVDLRSSRVRAAQQLLEGVRSGQPMAALLGYQFERGLHDSGLDEYIPAFRARYPLAPVVDPTAPQAEQAQQSVGARAVVDGVALRADRASYDGATPPIGADDDVAALRKLVDALDDTVDALGDLLLAESVHHLVGGNPLRAGLAIDSLAGGDGVPQDFEVTTTPRSAAVVTYAVGALADLDSSVRHAGWGADRAVALLDLPLERLCQSWLGDPAMWAFHFAADPAAPAAPTAPADPPAPADPTAPADATVTLADTGLSALEVVLGATPQAGTSSPVYRVLSRLAAPGRGLVAGVEGTGRYAELAALAGGWRAILAGASPLLPAHLDPVGGGGWAAADLDELAGRAGVWLSTVTSGLAGLGAARAVVRAGTDPTGKGLVAPLEALGAAGLRIALTAGAPETPADTATLTTVADTILGLPALSALPASLPTPPPPGGSRTESVALQWVGAVRAVVAGVVGDAVPLVPLVALSGTGADAILPANRPAGADAGAVADWLREVADVRPAVDGFVQALLGSEVLAAAAAAGDGVVAQTPVVAGAAWVATSAGLSTTNGPPTATGAPAGRATCVLVGAAGAAAPGAAGPVVAGLIVDSWAESIPRAPVDPGGSPDSTGGGTWPATEVAGLAFHSTRPDARAPQSLLLAVPPDPTRGWCAEDLHAVVTDTVALARLRTLDLSDLPELRGPVPLEGLGSAFI